MSQVTTFFVVGHILGELVNFDGASDNYIKNTFSKKGTCSENVENTTSCKMVSTTARYASEKNVSAMYSILMTCLKSLHQICNYLLTTPLMIK